MGPVYVEGFDFGYLTTDANGDGAAHFNLLSVPSGTYYAQFTVRIGVGCPASGFCDVVYRTGAPYSVNVEEITIP